MEPCPVPRAPFLELDRRTVHCGHFYRLFISGRKFILPTPKAYYRNEPEGYWGAASVE